EDTGVLQCSVETDQGERRSGGVGMAPVGQWTNVAFSYDSGSGTLTTYVNGVVGAQTVFGPGAITTNSNDLIVGPGAQTPAEASGAIVMLDELLVSHIVRSDVEIARGAFVDLPPPSFDKSLALPPGLDSDQLRVPQYGVNQAMVDLGKQLFFE